jgi:DNA invertase Pin-like site-specific DNA recombinase
LVRPRATTLAVWKLDRLGRSLHNLLEAAEGLRGREVALRSLTEHIDTPRRRPERCYAPEPVNA